MLLCVFFFSFLLLLFACLPEVPAEPTTPAPQPDIPLAEKSEKTPELPAPIAEAVTENRTVASPGVPTPVAAVHGQSRTEAEQASGTVEAVVLRRKSKPPQRTLNSIPDEDGFEEEELPGESAAAVPVFSYLLTPVYYPPVSLLPSHFYTNPQHILGQEIQVFSILLLNITCLCSFVYIFLQVILVSFCIWMQKDVMELKLVPFWTCTRLWAEDQFYDWLTALWPCKSFWG